MSLIRKMQNVQKRKRNAKMAYNATLAECQHSVIVTASCKSDTYCGSKVNDYRYISAGIGVGLLQSTSATVTMCPLSVDKLGQHAAQCQRYSSDHWLQTMHHVVGQRDKWLSDLWTLDQVHDHVAREQWQLVSAVSTLHSAVSVTVSRPNSWPTVVNWTLGLQRLID